MCSSASFMTTGILCWACGRRKRQGYPIRVMSSKSRHECGRSCRFRSHVCGRHVCRRDGWRGFLIPSSSGLILSMSRTFVVTPEILVWFSLDALQELAFTLRVAIDYDRVPNYRLPPCYQEWRRNLSSLRTARCLIISYWIIVPLQSKNSLLLHLLRRQLVKVKCHV